MTALLIIGIVFFILGFILLCSDKDRELLGLSAIVIVFSGFSIGVLCTANYANNMTTENIIRSISKSKDCYKIEFINDRFIESDSCQYKIGDTLYIKK